METLISTKIDWKKLVVVAFLIALSTAAVGLGVWYYMEQEVRIQAEYYEGLLDNKDVKVEASGEESSSACQPERAEPECEVTIAYERAGLFLGTEKTDIETKIIEPYIYYMNNVETGSKVVAVVVDKYPENERPAGYWFSITGVMDSGGTNGWLIGSGGAIDYWAPECMGTCQLSQAYVDAYPNNLPNNYEIR